MEVGGGRRSGRVFHTNASEKKSKRMARRKRASRTRRKTRKIMVCSWV
jgi:hypothetical protein